MRIILKYSLVLILLGVWAWSFGETKSGIHDIEMLTTTQWYNHNCGHIACSVLHGSNLWVAVHSGELIKINTQTGVVSTYPITGDKMPFAWIAGICIRNGTEVWMATDSGLKMFDGINWMWYDMSNSNLPENYITGICLDQFNNIWIGTENSGLVCFNGVNKWTIFSIEYPDLYHNSIKHLVCDCENRIWGILDDTEVFCFDSGAWTYHSLDNNTGLSRSYVNGMDIDNQSRLWIGLDSMRYGDSSSGGLVFFDGESKWQLYNTDNSPLPCNDVQYLTIDMHNNVWIVTNDNKSGLGSLTTITDDKAFHYYNRRNSSLTDLNITSIAFDESNTPYVCTERDVFKFSNYYLHEYYHVPSIVYHECEWIECIQNDTNNNIWVMIDSQIYSNKNGIWAPVSDINQRSQGNRISCMSIDKNNNIWIGMENSILTRHNEDSYVVYDLSLAGVRDMWIQGIVFDKIGRVWISCLGNDDQSALVKLENEKLTRIRLEEVGLLGRITCIDEISPGSMICGTEHGQLATINYDSIMIVDHPERLKKKIRINDLVVDMQGVIWIASSVGLAKLDGTKWNQFTTSNSPLPNNDVLCLATDTLGRLWIGTYQGGIACLDHETWVVHYKEDIWYGEFGISSICVDLAQSVWFGYFLGHGLIELRQAE